MILVSLFACRSVNTVRPEAEAEAESAANPFTAVVRFYRGPLNHLSAVRTGQCPMYPSDSAYSLQALKKHGMIMGWIMSLDRLMRCGRDETRLSPQIPVNGKWKTYDPVENNDFWWHRTAGKESASERP
jgi:putative component of membrane protein insertase Oxa1/YidC/SpoIIIJ protein YidD